MGFRQWVTNVLGGNTDNLRDHVLASSAAEDPLEEEAAGLNFRTAIGAHQQWKERLQSVIDGSHSEDLDVEVVSRDDRCVLGKWIHGEGGKLFGSDERFQELQKNHVHFHLCAGTVLKLAQTGRKTEAQALLKTGDYSKVSRDVMLDLAQMYNRASEKQN